MTTATPYGDTRMLIGGELCAAATGEWLTSINPATEEVLGRAPAGGSEDIDRAVTAASGAWSAWAALDVEERGRHLHELADRLGERADHLLELEIRDTGNTRGKMQSDVNSAIRQLRYYAGLGLEMKGESVPGDEGRLHFSVREPYGVVGRIVPFNHPVQFSASKLAAPLMAGNAVVMKPPEQSPLSAGVLAEICADVFPAGVVNIVTGDRRAGEALTRHPDVRRLALIGSPQTGMAIQRAAAEVSVKHVSLELGGKNPLIMFPDADLDAATAAAVAGMNFGHQGQSCGSTSRLFLHDDIHDDVLDRVVSHVESLRLGDPADPQTQMGAINSLAQYEKVRSYVQAGLEDGAKLVAGGSRPEGDQFTRGYWLRPTVFADVTPEMRIFQEEIFGPVLSVIRWRDVDDVIAMANATEYGLTASVWTQDITTAFRAVRRLDAGYCWINGVSRHFPGVSFGGRKNSGVGTEEGLDELLSYTQTKMINVLLG